MPTTMLCPTINSTFYACGDGSRFVGCCRTNPCGASGCAAGNLVSTSFDAGQATPPDEECSAGLFYTCTGAGTTTIPFWGCCESDPCQGGGVCPEGDLAGAFLSRNPSLADFYLEGWNGTFAEASTASSSSQGSTLTTSVAATVGFAAETTSAAARPAARSSSSGAIAGGVVGGLAVLAALILSVVFVLRRRNGKHGGSPEDPGHIKVQQTGIPPLGALAEAKHASPTMPSDPGSPQPPYSPAPPSYTTETRHMSYELPATQQFEMDSGQMYHPYRPDTGSPTA